MIPSRYLKHSRQEPFRSPPLHLNRCLRISYRVSRLFSDQPYQKNALVHLKMKKIEVQKVPSTLKPKQKFLRKTQEQNLYDRYVNDQYQQRNQFLLQFIPDTLSKAFEHNTHEEWIHKFLSTIGKNKELSKGLKKIKRFWFKPHLLPLDRLQRCTGPEKEMQFVQPIEGWRRRVQSMKNDILRYWQPPPILCEYRENGVLSVRDGSHRLEALKEAGYTSYWTMIWFNNKRDYTTYAKSHMKKIKLSKETNEIQRVIALRNSRNHRYRHKEFILEGRIAIDQAFENGWKVKSLFYNKDFKLSEWAKKHLAEQKYNIAYEITTNLMDKIADKTESTEMIGIAETQIHNFESYKPRSSSDIIVVLHEPKSAGNVGMMIRSAVAFGAKAIVLSGHSADEYDPKCIRASVGTFFSIPIYHVEGIQKFTQKIEELKSEYPLSIIATGDKGAVAIKDVMFNSSLLFLVLGNETMGISSGYKQIADYFVKIPLDGKFTSLNVAAAGTVFLYEVLRQRKEILGSKR